MVKFSIDQTFGSNDGGVNPSSLPPSGKDGARRQPVRVAENEDRTDQPRRNVYATQKQQEETPLKPPPKQKPAKKFSFQLPNLNLFKSSGQQSTTEMSKSKELLEAERTYRQGMSSLRDIIAPSALKIESNELQISGMYSRTYFVLAYPRYLAGNWLYQAINLDVPLDVSMFIYPLDSGVILKKLRDKVGQIQASISLNQEAGRVRDPMLETAYRDAEELRDRLTQGTEHYFRFSLYFTLYSDELEKLNKASTSLETLLGSKLIVTKKAFLQMKKGFNSTLPMGHDELAVSSNLNTEPLSSTFPFVSSDLTSNDGILYGINQHNNSLILFDRFSMENANTVVFAKSGAGKSYAVKLEILRSLMMGTDVIVVDPEHEYQHLCDSVGGAFLNVSLNSPTRVNPFDLPRGVEGETDEEILRSAVVNLLGLMNVMLGKLDASEESIMDRALWETYAKKDITPASGYKGKEVPVIDDLVEILSGIEGGENISVRLQKFTQGTFSGLFNNRTNVELNNQMVVFSVRDLEDNLRPIAIYIILNFIWNIVRTELKKRILVIDEAWWMLQNDDSARFLFSIAKRSRKYYLGVTTITQDVTDFLQSPYGEPIVTNSSIQLLLKQSPAAMELLVKVFFLTEGEKYLLLESDVGEGLFFAGLKHVAIKVVASYIEDQIITTDPRQLLEIEEAKKQRRSRSTEE
jgi:conjugal transfer ATP-binding protein TraC